MAVEKPSYLREYISDKDVGALHPSSRFLVRRLIRCLRPESIRTIVELGPGPGIATRPILGLIRPGARYIAIEKNPAFLAALKSSIDDPRLRVVEGDACSVREILASEGVATADAVIASIPFSFLTKDQRAGLVDTIGSLLADDGDFVIFHQYTPKMRTLARNRFPYVRVQFEPRNIMPCFLIHCRKKP
jgi:phosphatidylethanolamine/phosphatidyl-N-methylethanolamine N-methyltransferase